jgi:serine O-acetyltransferase
MFENLRRDRQNSPAQWYRRGGFWIVAVYRFGAWADSVPNVVLRIPMWALYLCFKLLLGLFTHNIYLWAGRGGARIGPGLCLYHPANIMIGRGVEIGADCSIYHEVTLGTGQIPGTPKIGNHVTIYPGARLLGGIEIGNNVMIGANCVVTKNVPPDSIILAAPSRAIPRSLSTQARRWDEGREPLQPLNNQPNPPEL